MYVSILAGLASQCKEKPESILYKRSLDVFYRLIKSLGICLLITIFVLFSKMIGFKNDRLLEWKWIAKYENIFDLAPTASMLC